MTSILGTYGREASERRTGRGNRRRSRPAFHFDRLEPRTLLTATLSVDGAGAASLLSQTSASTVDLAYNTGTHAYTFDSSEGILAGTVDAAFTYDQVSANEATLTPVDAGTQDFTALSFDQDVENIDYSITSLSTTTTFVDTSLTPPVGTPPPDTFDFGATGHAQSSITAPVSVALTTESAAITVDDSADTTSHVINIGSTQVDFNSTPAFSYASTATVASLAVLGGSGGNSVDVTGTPAGTSAASTTTTITLGSGNDTATVVGLGLAAGTTSSNFRIDGGTGTNTLVLDSSGTTVDLSAPGIVTFGDPTSFAYANFSAIQVSGTQINTAPVITAGATITTAQNVPLINAVVATFTDADTIENASSYTAAIQWGDGTTSAGTITSSGTSTILGATVNDYSITGTHTYTTGGIYATSVVLTDLGGTFTSAVGGIPVTTTLAWRRSTGPGPRSM